MDFAFDEAVAGVFPDMIRRSVPGYELVVPMTGLLLAGHMQRLVGGRAHGKAERADPLRIYDLGCSLGATTLATLRGLEALDVDCPDLSIVAVDNAAAMVRRAGENLTDPRVQCLEADIRHLPLEPCQAVTLNWVLQFLPSADRPGVLRRIRASLAADGLLILSEKVRSDDAGTEAFNQAAHRDFKRANGYSELEISQKRSALEQVMITDTVEQHRARLKAAGFSTVRLWYQCLNWASFVATP